MLFLDWKDWGLGGRAGYPHLSGHINTLKLHVEGVDLFLKRKLRAVTWVMSQKLLELTFKALSSHSPLSLLKPFSQYYCSYTSPSQTSPFTLFHLGLYIPPPPSLLRFCLHHNCILRDTPSRSHFSFLCILQSLPSVPPPFHIFLDDSKPIIKELPSNYHKTQNRGDSLRGPQEPGRKHGVRPASCCHVG